MHQRPKANYKTGFYYIKNALLVLIHQINFPRCCQTAILSSKRPAPYPLAFVEISRVQHRYPLLFFIPGSERYLQA